VGKSSLLNALAGKRISIVQDQPGVTRDRISAPVQIQGRWVELVDTGGYGFVDPDQLTEHIRHQIDLAVARADLVLFVVDCQQGLTSADQQIAAMLRECGAKTLLVANKDDKEKLDPMLGDFGRLGLGTPVGVSAVSGRQVDELLEAIARNVNLKNAPKELPEPVMHLAVVGKRNAGKSTLVNAIAKLYDEPEGSEGGGDRVIVSEVPGTTRDSVDVRFEKEGQTLVVIDTAGVRKKRRIVGDDVAFYSFHRAQRSVRRADVVLMLIDGTEALSEPDRQLAAYIAEQFKPLILVVNKWDKTREMALERRHEQDPDAPADDATLMREFKDYLGKALPHVSWAPVAFITAKDGRNVNAMLETAMHLHKQANLRLGTGRLNAAIEQVLASKEPPTKSGRRAKVFYATQVDVAPPSIVLFVNKPAYFDATYQRFILNRFREMLPWGQVPIKLVVRGRSERTMAKNGAAALDRPAPAKARPRRPVPRRGKKR
jgi:GTP-binding protein